MVRASVQIKKGELVTRSLVEVILMMMMVILMTVMMITVIAGDAHCAVYHTLTGDAVHAVAQD